MRLLLIFTMTLLSLLPLAVLRGLGSFAGAVLYKWVPKRAHIARVNLKLCFSKWSEAQIEEAVQAVFVFFAKAWLDRAWLWQGGAQTIQSRIKWVGDPNLIAALLNRSESNHLGETLMVFAPHFVGLDVGWTALSMQRQGALSTIYTPQSSKAADQWMRESRSRFGEVHLFTREDGVKRVVSGIKRGELLYLLPDMNFGPEESIFVPFFGVLAATVPSLSRFAKLSGSRVIPMTTQMTDEGYEIQVHAPLEDFPSEDFAADTARMNQWLEQEIQKMPDQYFWLHKRFKTRPEGSASLYGKD